MLAHLQARARAQPGAAGGLVLRGAAGPGELDGLLLLLCRALPQLAGVRREAMRVWGAHACACLRAGHTVSKSWPPWASLRTHCVPGRQAARAGCGLQRPSRVSAAPQ